MHRTLDQPRPLTSAPLASIRRTRRRLFILPAVPALCAVAIVIGAAHGGAQGRTPVFRARTELVRLDVSVTDRAGRAVGDLRSNEIEITENGQRRPVVLFRHITEVSDTATDVDARAFDEPSGPDALPAGQLYVLVFDQQHIRSGHEQRARLAAERFVSRELKPGDAVAIYGLPGPGPMLNLTCDLIKARTTLAAVRGQAHRVPGAMSVFEAYRVARGGSVAGNLGTVTPPPMGRAAEFGSGARGGAPANGAAEFDDVLRAQAEHVVAQAETESRVFLSQLADLLRRIRVIDGRKTFILFSEGFFIDNLATRLEQVASAAAESNSLIYSIDLNTMSAPDESASFIPALELSERRDPLATLALETNGRLIAGAANLDAVLAGIAAETSDYYLVAFQPPPDNDSRAYHRVTVKTTRPGLTVRTRTGYSSAPAARAITDRQAIDAALSVPRTSTAIPIEYTTYERGGAVADRPAIIASVLAYLPRHVNLAAAADGHSDVVFVVRDATTGEAVASGADHLPSPDGDPDTAGGRDAVSYCVQFDVPPGEYWMRVLVREPGGVIGTADRRFHVWPLDGAGVTTSDLIVTRLDGTRFDPPARPAVRREDEVLAYLEIYNVADSAKTEVDLLRAGSGEVVATAEPVLKSGSRGETIVRARLPVAGLSDGAYAARVRIVAPNQAPRTVIRNFQVVSN